MARSSNRPLSYCIRRKTFYIIKCLTRYPLELIGTIFFCLFFGLLPLKTASAIGGWLGRTIGPRLKISWVARYNLMKAFPEKTTKEIDEIVVGMWDNTLRTFVEYPHLRAICMDPHKYATFVDYQYCEEMRDDNKAGILFSAHFGNWEVSSVVGGMMNIPFHRIYRSSNNPYVEWLFRYFRDKIPGELVPKGIGGFRQVVSILKKGGHLALMIDQKLNEGIDVNFLGYPAKTTPSLASLALKNDYPAYPLHCERYDGHKFRVVMEPYLRFEKTGNMEQDVRAFMEQANRSVEAWIIKNPEQWFWLHKRWPDTKTNWKDLYKQRRLWKKGEKPADVFAQATKNRVVSA